MLGRLTGPADVDSYREGIQSMPSDCSSTAIKNEFFTANPTPFRLGSSLGYSCQKKG